MAINLIDKLVSLIPAHIVDGKDVSKVNTCRYKRKPNIYEKQVLFLEQPKSVLIFMMIMERSLLALFL